MDHPLMILYCDNVNTGI